MFKKIVSFVAANKAELINRGLPIVGAMIGVGLAYVLTVVVDGGESDLEVMDNESDDPQNTI